MPHEVLLPFSEIPAILNYVTAPTSSCRSTGQLPRNSCHETYKYSLDSRYASLHFKHIFKLLPTSPLSPSETMSTRTAQVEEYGWGAVPINPKEFAPTKAPAAQLVKDTPLPDTQVAKAALEYAKTELPAHTFNHSMRVFYYGTLPPTPYTLPLANTSPM